jgi:hypothetical protein
MVKVNIQRTRQPECKAFAGPKLCQHTWHPDPAKIGKMRKLGFEVEAFAFMT